MTAAAYAPFDAVLEQSLRDIGIPPRPVILDRIAAEMRKEDPNLKYLGSAIGADVSLAASLIKTANSPFFGFHSRVRSSTEALQMLGLDISARAIAGIVLRKVFPPPPQLERFWDASAQIAALSGWLGQTLHQARLRADDAYTYGLFRDCGIPVLLRRFPKYAASLAIANNDASRSFTSVEYESLPTDHTMVGCLLAQNWWLPEEICLSIRHHHDLEALESLQSGLPQSSRCLIAAGQVAEYIVQHLTGLSHTQEWPKLGAACLRLLDLTEDELPALQEAAAVALRADA